MTINQLKYIEQLETRRANQARERLTSESNAELKRHNLASEQLSASQIAELARHNQASEVISSRQVDELGRHNLATEDYANRNLDFQKRQAYVVHSENLRRMEQTDRDLDLKELQTTTNARKTNAQTRRENVGFISDIISIPLNVVDTASRALKNVGLSLDIG